MSALDSPIDTKPRRSDMADPKFDVVVTVPKDIWDDWLAEGDLPGEAWSGNEFHFYMGGPAPVIYPGNRVYVVARDRLRGFAPLVRKEFTDNHRWALVRRGGAQAVTINENVRGFRGWRRPWWPREAEVPFPAWKVGGKMSNHSPDGLMYGLVPEGDME